MEEKRRKWLLYCSYTVKGVEKNVDYTLISPKRKTAKDRAMDRMIAAGGENRCIDACHEITREFLEKEARMAGHGRGRYDETDIE